MPVFEEADAIHPVTSMFTTHTCNIRKKINPIIMHGGKMCIFISLDREGWTTAVIDKLWERNRRRMCYIMESSVFVSLVKSKQYI